MPRSDEPNNQILLAKTIATVAHLRQVDKNGQPYIGHPARVAARIDPNIPTFTIATAAAWLHDVLEDTPITAEDLKACGVEWQVIDTVQALTRQRGQASADYYTAIRRHPIALAVKLADIADNTDPNRLALLDDATVLRLTKKYARARFALGASPIDPDNPPTPEPTGLPE